MLGILETHNPNVMDLIEARTEEAFIEATERVLERVLRTIESGAKQYAALDERGLSTLLADLLTLAGCQAAAERNNNGHVDVVLEHSFSGRWKYLGECKIHGGFKYHLDGCEQLLGYCTGREQRAFCLDFFDVVGMFEKLEALRKRMDSETPLSQSGPSADHRIKGAFLTTHTHATGAGVELLHLGCSVPKQ